VTHQSRIPAVEIVALPGGVQSAVLHRMPHNTAWFEWLRRHGIDFADLAVPGGIFRDVPKRRVVYSAYARDADGRVLVNGDRAVTTTRAVQLEAAPLPFPEVTR